MSRVRSPETARQVEPLVVAPKEDLGTEVEAVVVVRRHDQPGVPVPAQRGAVGGRLGLDVEPLLAAPVEARQHPVLELRVDDVGVLGIYRRIEAVAAERDVPVGVADASPQGLRGSAKGVVVLSAAVDVVEGLVVRGGELVELGDRQVCEVPPAPAEVEALVETAVRADDQVFGVERVEGHGVEVDVHAAGGEAVPSLAAVVGHLQVGVHRVDAVEAVGVGVELVVVHRRPRLVVRGAAPALAHVHAAKGAAFAHRDLDDGVEDVRIDRRDRHPDLPLVARWQPAVDLAPSVAAVGGLVDPRPWTAVDHRPLVAPALPRGRVDHVGVARVEVDLVDAGVLVDIENELPALAAVRRAVQSALPARGPEGALRGNVDRAGVVGVDCDHAYMARRLQPHVGERQPPVHRLVDPIAVADRALAVVLSGSHPECEGVARVERDTPDRVRAVVVEDGGPGGAPVGGLPDVAGGDGHVPGAPVRRVDGDVRDPPGCDRRSDAPPTKRREQLRTELGRVAVVLGVEGGGAREENGGERKGEEGARDVHGGS